MPTPATARRQYEQVQKTQARTIAAIHRSWRRMGGDWDVSWARIEPEITAEITAAQIRTATDSANFVEDYLREVDLPNRPLAEINTAAFGGFTSDGLPMSSLLYGGVVQARTGASEGLTQRQALGRGRDWLDLVSAGQIADIARQVTGMATAARPGLGGYTRFLSPPSCPRCTILAGRTYRYSTGFARHPGCDCAMLPASSHAWAESEGFIADPEEAFDRGLINGLSRAETKAIQDGAGIDRVVNARRGITNVGSPGRRRRITVSGDSTRSIYGRGQYGARPGGLTKRGGRYRRSVDARLTPEQIYRQARSREEAVEYLTKYGYLSNLSAVRRGIYAR